MAVDEDSEEMEQRWRTMLSMTILLLSCLATAACGYLLLSLRDLQLSGKTLFFTEVVVGLDLAQCCLLLCFTIPSQMKGAWLFGDFACFTQAFVGRGLRAGQFLALLLLAMHGACSTRSCQAFRHYRLLFFLAWALVGSVLIFPFIVDDASYNFNVSFFHCDISIKYLVIHDIVTFCVPIVLLTILSVPLISRLRNYSITGPSQDGMSSTLPGDNGRGDDGVTDSSVTTEMTRMTSAAQDMPGMTRREMGVRLLEMKSVMSVCFMCTETALLLTVEWLFRLWGALASASTFLACSTLFACAGYVVRSTSIVIVERAYRSSCLFTIINSSGASTRQHNNNNSNNNTAAWRRQSSQSCRSSGQSQRLLFPQSGGSRARRVRKRRMTSRSPTPPSPSDHCGVTPKTYLPMECLPTLDEHSGVVGVVDVADMTGLESPKTSVASDATRRSSDSTKPSCQDETLVVPMATPVLTSEDCRSDVRASSAGGRASGTSSKVDTPCSSLGADPSALPSHGSLRLHSQASRGTGCAGTQGGRLGGEGAAEEELHAAASTPTSTPTPTSTRLSFLPFLPERKERRAKAYMNSRRIKAKASEEGSLPLSHKLLQRFPSLWSWSQPFQQQQQGKQQQRRRQQQEQSRLYHPAAQHGHAGRRIGDSTSRGPDDRGSHHQATGSLDRPGANASLDSIKGGLFRRPGNMSFANKGDRFQRPGTMDSTNKGGLFQRPGTMDSANKGALFQRPGTMDSANKGGLFQGPGTMDSANKGGLFQGPGTMDSANNGGLFQRPGTMDSANKGGLFQRPGTMDSANKGGLFQRTGTMDSAIKGGLFQRPGTMDSANNGGLFQRPGTMDSANKGGLFQRPGTMDSANKGGLFQRTGTMDSANKGGLFQRPGTMDSANEGGLFPNPRRKDTTEGKEGLFPRSGGKHPGEKSSVLQREKKRSGGKHPGEKSSVLQREKKRSKRRGRSGKESGFQVRRPRFFRPSSPETSTTSLHFVDNEDSQWDGRPDTLSAVWLLNH